MGFFSNLTNTNSKKSNLEEIKLLYETTSDEYEIEEGVDIESYYAGKAKDVVAIIESLSKCKDIEHSEFIFWKAHLYCFIGELEQKAKNFEAMIDYFEASIIGFDSIEEEVPFFVLYPESPIALNVKKYTSDEMNCLSGVRSKFASSLSLSYWGEEDWVEEVIIENIIKSEENFEKEPLTLGYLTTAYEQAFMFYKKSDFSKSNSYAKKGIKVLESIADLESEMNAEARALFRFKYNYMVQQRHNDRAEADKLEKDLGLYVDLKDIERVCVLAAPLILEIIPKKNLLQREILDDVKEMTDLGAKFFNIFEGVVDKPDDMDKDLSHYYRNNYSFGRRLIRRIQNSTNEIFEIEAIYWEGHLHMYLANISSLFKDGTDYAIEHFKLAIDLFSKLDKKHKSFRFYEASPIHLDVFRFTKDRLFHLAEARRLYSGFLTQHNKYDTAEKIIIENIKHCEDHYKKDPETYYSLAETYHQANKFFWTEDLDKSKSYILKAINLFEKNKDLETYISEGDYTPLEANWSYLVNLEKMDADASIVSNQSEKVSLYIDDINDNEAITALFDIQREDLILPKGSVNSFEGLQNFG